MNQSHFFSIYGAIFILAMSFISCNTEEQRSSILQNDLVSNRTHGSYEVSNGRLKFLSIDDYQETVEFLSDASQTQLDSFRNSFSIVTPAKAMLQFSEAICCDNSISSAQMDSIESVYSTQIKIVVNGDGDKIVSLLFDANPEFMNLNGEFQIGTTIIKQIGAKLVSITKTNLVDPSALNNTVVSDASTGVFVTDTPLFPPAMCCPSSDSKETHYDDGSRKKVVANYAFLNATKFFQDPFDPRLTLVIPELQVVANGKHERRKRFVFSWWGCHKTGMSHDWEVDFDHNLVGLSSPRFIDRTRTVSNTCEINFVDHFFGSPVSTVPPLGVPSVVVCVTRVYQRVVGNSRAVTITCN
jgi:hypothetical protein